MRVEIVNLSGENIYRPGLKSWVKKVCQELKDRGVWQEGVQAQKLTLAFISRGEMRKLNHKWRKKNKATDILSFAPVEKDSLGELALCLSVIVDRQTSFLKNRSLKPKFFKSAPALTEKPSRGLTPEGTAWLYYLILHGVLHLLGFEHGKDKKQSRIMRQLQNRVFDKLTRSKYTDTATFFKKSKGDPQP